MSLSTLKVSGSRITPRTACSVGDEAQVCHRRPGRETDGAVAGQQGAEGAHEVPHAIGLAVSVACDTTHAVQDSLPAYMAMDGACQERLRMHTSKPLSRLDLFVFDSSAVT